MADYRDNTVQMSGHLVVIPTHMHDSLVEYIETGRPVGHFLTAVLSNDLKGAVQHADHINIYLITDYVCWLYNRAPSSCWGSPENVKQWIANRGLNLQQEGS